MKPAGSRIAPKSGKKFRRLVKTARENGRTSVPSVGSTDLDSVIRALASGTQIRSASQMAVVAKGKQVMEIQGQNALNLIEAASTGKGLRIDARA